MPKMPTYDLQELINTPLGILGIVGAFFGSLVLIGLVWFINEKLKDLTNKKHIIDFATIFGLLVILAGLITFGASEFIGAKQEYDNTLLTSQTLTNGTGSISFDSLPGHYYDIYIHASILPHSTSVVGLSSITGTFEIITSDNELLDSRNFHEEGYWDEDEDEGRSWPEVDYAWRSEVFTSELGVLVKVEITDVTGNLEPTLIKVFIDPPKDTDGRQFIGVLVLFMAFFPIIFTFLIIVAIISQRFQK